MKAPWTDPSLRELLALAALAAFGCGLALAQGDFLFAVVFCAASVVTIIEAIRRSRYIRRKKSRPRPKRLVLVGFADDRRLVGLVFVLFVFVFVLILIIIVVGGISRRGRGARDGEYLLDATCPLLLQTSVKLYGIGGHVVLLWTFVFEGWARSGSSPSASAQYISASFRYWRLCRSDFATAARRANFFAFAR